MDRRRLDRPCPRRCWACCLGTVRFLFPNVLSEPPSTFKAGDVDGYEEGKVEDKFKEVGSWVILLPRRPNRRIIYALSTTCTHLGCTPNWLEGGQEIQMPLSRQRLQDHRRQLRRPRSRGRSNAGPSSKTDDGQIIVDKSRKFQKELGQWDDPDSIFWFRT